MKKNNLLKTINLESKTIRIYNSEEELPAFKSSAADLILLKEHGLKPSMPGVMDHVDKIARFALDGKPGDLENAIDNFKMGLLMIINKINYKHLAFGCMIHDIDGEVLTDISEENLSDVILDLEKQGLQNDHVADAIDNVLKKKFEPAFEYYSLKFLTAQFPTK